MTPTPSDLPPAAAHDRGPDGVDVVIPVKPLDRAKSRLAVLGDDVRRDLALAFVRDVLTAVRGAAGLREVVVVTADEQVAALVRSELGGRARLVADTEPRELNRALHRGVDDLRATRPDADRTAVLALCADLPALTSRALGDLLAVAPRSGAGFVADRTGTGTTAYLAPPALFDPRFGPGSRDAHARAAVDLTARVPAELRADVDSPADLAPLVAHPHLGGATRAALARHGLDRDALAGTALPRA
ncbi:2-phospho-L-lactate guanylyltransferase [Nocardioides sp. HDW12B]|uniref:2-phospho-L-lactate guanylyltransferase n=1 Tax=Nocardioides sp. HDW12B TaxID=2714939 RepID=UPI001408B653|nr:2-phospho-L-lactate guanylyltransferase [Nocardioides sp. HDW12B]QIK67011.1 2-phospho-L-lactate guanylyltransferase [Nocardioides sp. HDW12B]